MADLIHAPNIADRDGFYQDLLGAHEGLDEAASQALNARLVLVLANHIGDKSVLDQALDLAKRTGGAPAAE
ncbi:MAG: DUF2783 domain-containing protein [Pseudomonadota bacterium]